MTDVFNSLQETLGATCRVDREIGVAAGNASRIFLVHDASVGLDLVVTVLAPGVAKELDRERFMTEIRALARVQHPNIVPVLSTGIVLQLPYYTMPYVAADTARARLDASGPFPVREAIAVLRDVAKALEFAHAEGVVHGNLRPEHILLAATGAFVTEFGLARALAVSRGDDTWIDATADLCAFGATAYEMLTERVPGEELAPIASRRKEIPATLARLVMECLESDAERRPSANELVFRLDAIASSYDSMTKRKKSKAKR
jgi:serine/threonine protein kinase